MATVTGGYVGLGLAGGAHGDPPINLYWVTDTTKGTPSNTGDKLNYGYANAAGILNGGWAALSARDYSAAFIYCEPWAAGNTTVPALNQSTGVILGITSGAGADLKERCWVVRGGGAAKPEPNTEYNAGVIINVATVSTAAFDNASFDASAVTGVGVGGVDGQKYVSVNSGEVGTVTPYVLKGTGGGFADILKYSRDSGRRDIISPSDKFHVLTFGFEVGDGATATDWDEELLIFELKGSFDVNYPNAPASHYEDNDLGFKYLAAPGSPYTHTKNVWKSRTRFFFVAEGVQTFTDCQIINSGELTIDDDPVFVRGLLANYGTFSCGKAPQMHGATLRGGTELVITDPTDFASRFYNNTIEDATDGIVFDFPQSATVTLNALNFVGGSNNIKYTGAGTLTIQPSNGTSVSTTNATGGGTINVAATPVTLTVKVFDEHGDAITDGTAHVYVKAAPGGAMAAGTEIIKAFTNPSGVVSDSRTYSGNQPIEGWIRKSSASPYYKQAPINASLSGSNLTLEIQLERDD